jgi:hypothetical protein
MYSVLGNDKKYFRSNETNRINHISKCITNNLSGLELRPIVYPDERIHDLVTKIETNNINISKEEVDQMVIKLVCDTIRTEIEMTRYNNSLDKFDTILGDFNRHGLTRTSGIKVRNKKPTSMEFHLRY